MKRGELFGESGIDAVGARGPRRFMRHLHASHTHRQQGGACSRQSSIHVLISNGGNLRRNLCFPSMYRYFPPDMHSYKHLKAHTQVWSRCCGLPSGATAPFGARFQCCCCCPCSSGHCRRRRGSAPRARAASTTLPNIDHSHLGAHLSTEGAVPRRTEQKMINAKNDVAAKPKGRPCWNGRETTETASSMLRNR